MHHATHLMQANAGTQAVAPCRPLQGNIDRLESTLAVLGKTIEEAAQRLDFVLQPESPMAMCGQKDAPPRPPISAASDRVESLASRANAMIDRFRDILDRLDV